jgi:hypothetical protein
MAQTGINIQVTNTQLGSTPQVNVNSMLIVVGATAGSGGTMPLELSKPYMITSPSGLTALGVTQANNPELYKQVNDFYNPTSAINNNGNILWIVGVPESNAGNSIKGTLVPWLRETVANGFEYRPRNIMISLTSKGAGITPSDVQTAINSAYTEGFSVVCVFDGQQFVTENLAENGSTSMEDLSEQDAMMVGVVIVTDEAGGRPIVGRIGGYMSQLSVGTSIGDTSLTRFDTSLFFVDPEGAAFPANTPCGTLALDTINDLGSKQYIFARTRPPRNGLWFNDGATCAEATTALSTLEAARTIASMVDDLRDFFTPYINSKVPVNASGDIDPTYKQVVIDNATATVINPYIESGDISDARISLVAQNNDMVGTRTWEVTLQILAAPTLRWVDAFVFYVSSLT